MRKCKKRIPPSVKSIYPILMLITCLLMSVGYATMNNMTLKIEGLSQALEQKGIIITEAKFKNHTNAVIEETELKIITGATLNSSVGLSPTTTDTQVTYTITLYNTNDYNSQFDKAKFIENFYDNPDITFVLSEELTTDTILAPNESVTFDITFKYKNGVTPSTDNNILNSYINFEFIVAPTSVGTYSFTAEAQTFIAPYDGLYRIELWGASGETKGEFIGGKGAYTKGEIYLNKGTSLEIYVGGKGSPGIAGFNGGGKVSSGYGGNSGGATDVRLDTSTLTRIMVAGGGGASGYRGEEYGDGHGGSGGGLIAYSGTSFNNSRYYGYAYGTGGDQTTGGLMYWTDTGSGNRETGYYSSTYSGSNLYYVGGAFFQGGHAAASGGGGYYGGGAAFHGGGGGGSSFISGHDGCDAIKETSTVSSIIHAGHSIHYSGHTFINTLMIDGQGYQWTNEKNTSQPGMPTQDGTSTMTGNDGNGFAKITLVDINDNIENIYITDAIYDKSENSLDSENATITTFYKQTLISKTSLEPYVSTSNTTIKVTLHNSSDYAMTFDDITYNENLDVAYTNKNIKYTFDKQGTKIASGESINVKVTFTYADGADLTQNTLTSMLNFKFTLEPTVVGTFDYTGDYQVYTPSQSGIYKVELWGASGGDTAATNANDQEHVYVYGGNGGYSSGEVSLTAGDILYVVVGGEGKGSTSWRQTLEGGYNGGGTVTAHESWNHMNGSGGGATHIAKMTGLLSELYYNQDQILLVAGGGGGSRNQQNNDVAGARYGNGGAGGGLEGIVATSYGGTGILHTCATCAAGQETTEERFGQGAGSTGQAAGGGGWQGGGSGTQKSDSGSTIGSGSGGSGYIDGTDDGNTIPGNQPVPSHDGKSTMIGNDGDGHAKITLISSTETNNTLSINSVIYQKNPTPLENENATITNYYGNSINAKISLEPNNQDSEVTIITNIYNPTASTYYLKGITNNTEDNSNITYTYTNTPEALKPYQNMTVTITFKYITNADLTQNVLNALLSLEFSETKIITNSTTDSPSGNIIIFDTEQNEEGIVLNGENSYANFNNTTATEFPLTYSITFNTKETAGVLFGDYATKAALGFVDQRIVINLGNTQANSVLEFKLDKNLTIGEWYTFDIIYNSLTDHKLYLNGEEITTRTSRSNFWFWGDETSYVGTRPLSANYSTAYNFNGTIKRFMVYNKVLTEDEIIQNYNATTCSDIITDNLAIHYEFALSN